jgi:hypothetical protein
MPLNNPLSFRAEGEESLPCFGSVSLGKHLLSLPSNLLSRIRERTNLLYRPNAAIGED